MKEFIGPFDFSSVSLVEMREIFSKDWRNYFNSTVITSKLLHFISTDKTHIVISPEFEIAGAGVSREDAQKTFIVSLNGLYGHYLLRTGPFGVQPVESGIADLIRYFESLGWSFKDNKMVVPSLSEYIKRRPEFKKNVMDKVEVMELTFEVECPDLLRISTQNLVKGDKGH